MLIGLKGRMGEGKTVSTVMLGKGVIENTTISTVVSNFRTDITDIYVENPKELQEVSNKLNERDVSVLYLLDEIWAWMDARESNTNDIMNDFVVNSRKRGVFGIWNAQKFHMVDRRLRELSDYLGLCSHRQWYDNPTEHDLAKIILFEVFEDNLFHYTTLEYNPEHFYGMYDTEEEVSSKNAGEMYQDDIEDYIESVENGEFETKAELESYINLNEDLSQKQAEDLTHEVFRQLRASKSDDDGTGQQKLQDLNDVQDE